MTPSPVRIIHADHLRQFMTDLFTAAGCAREDAGIAADVLAEADLRGYGTHGLLRLPTMIRRLQSGMINRAARPRILQERPGSAQVDADRALGPVGALFGARLALRKAAEAGTAAVGVVNGDHIGLAGYYVEQIARAGYVGLLTSVTQPLVHPLGGSARLLGTNPFAVALPAAGPDPLLLDFATSEIAYGTVLAAQARGALLPGGVAVDAEGRPTTAPARAAQGALAPFGGHKGFGLCLVLGLLAGPLLGAKVGGPLGDAVRAGHYDKGELIIAFDPAAFGSADTFPQAVRAHLDEVKASRKLPGVESIRLPGERAWAERAERLDKGVPIAAEVWQEVAGVAEKLQVPLPPI